MTNHQRVAVSAITLAILAIAAVAASAMLGACHDATQPPAAPPTHDLVFEGYMGDVPELLLQDESGTVRRILPPGTVSMDPAPSPDGTRIVFVVADYGAGTGDLFVVRRDGTGLQQLTTDPGLDDQPAWSPDGSRIAFRSFRTQRDGDIWVMDADGSHAVNLTPDPLPGVTDERRPAWSPDGTRIAYASNAGGNVDIWTMAADGSDKQRLTSTLDYDTEPTWSPNGSTIAFRRSSTGSGSDLSLIDVASGSVQPLALAGEQRMPAWSPDGTRLIFVHQMTVSDRPDLFSVGTDGAALTPLVTAAVSGGSLNPAFLRRVLPN